MRLVKRHFLTFLLSAVLLMHNNSHGNEPAELARARSSFDQQMKLTTDPIKAKYHAYLEDLKKAYGAKGDTSAVQLIQKEIDDLGFVAPPPVGTSQDMLVVWNQNNGSKGDRGTKKINIVLLDSGRAVWKKNGVRLTWNADQQTKDEIPVPAIRYDKIRIEIEELINERGGLAEVQLMRGGKNLMLGATTVASGYWELDPKHAPAMLTDGLPETFWLLNDKQQGWAEITLNPAR